VRRLVVLHTNDIHGRVEGLARVATLVERARREEDAPVLYVDAGDVEDTTNRLSNLTKGVGLHRLLRVAGCRAVAVGNAAVIRYGIGPLPEQAAAGGYPQLAANLRQNGEVVPGAQASALIDVDGIRIGLVGLTARDWPDIYEDAFRLELPEDAPLVQAESARLREQGADAVLLLSHLGLRLDRELAPKISGAVDLVVGSHSHNLLPAGELVGPLTIVHAGEYGEHLGRVELAIGNGRVDVVDVRVDPVPAETPPHTGVLAELEAAERDLEAFLGEVLGELRDPLDVAHDRECASATFMADVLRERTGADVAVICAGVAFRGSLERGPLTRGALYEACPSPGAPGIAELTGRRLRALLVRGLDPDFAREAPRGLRGVPRGLMHLSGGEIRDGELRVAGGPVEPERIYRVGASDWELDRYGGYADPAWGLEIEYELPTVIMREAVEDHLRLHPKIEAPGPRIYSPLL
jgi:2',3'-cyclic-nucleotide 2'-phosphodiesterase (5'-nucleotidase family)